MIALMLEAQTLFTVVQTVESGSPAPRAHCLAGFCPRLDASQGRSESGQETAYFAERTLPMNTSSTLSGLMPALWTAATSCQRMFVPDLTNVLCTFDGMRTKLCRTQTRQGPGIVLAKSWCTCNAVIRIPEKHAHRRSGRRDDVDWSKGRHCHV